MRPLRSKYKHRKNYRLTEKDLYQCYTDKKRPHERYPTFPYVPNDEVTDNEYSLTFKEWKKIVSGYFKYVRDNVLFEGHQYDLPHRLGSFQIVKYKSNNYRIDFFKTITTGKYHYHDNEATENYCPLLVWNKPKKYRHKYSELWRAIFTENAGKKLSELIHSDISTLNKFNLNRKVND